MSAETPKSPSVARPNAAGLRKRDVAPWEEATPEWPMACDSRSRNWGPDSAPTGWLPDGRADLADIGAGVEDQQGVVALHHVDLAARGEHLPDRIHQVLGLGVLQLDDVPHQAEE